MVTGHDIEFLGDFHRVRGSAQPSGMICQYYCDSDGWHGQVEFVGVGVHVVGGV